MRRIKMMQCEENCFGSSIIDNWNRSDRWGIPSLLLRILLTQRYVDTLFNLVIHPPVTQSHGIGVLWGDELHRLKSLRFHKSGDANCKFNSR